MSELYIVYSIRNIKTEQRYVGSTRHLEERRKAHFSGLKSGKHKNKKLQEACIEYGIASFEWEVLESSVVPEERSNREGFWAIRYNAITQGYNTQSIPIDTLEERKWKEKHKRFMDERQAEDKELIRHLVGLEQMGLSSNPHFIAIKQHLMESRNLADYLESEETE